MKKTVKSPDNNEVTPNKKKLKQARLPFMLLSDVSTKTESPPSRKRKLSVPDAEPVTKVGKVCKENSITEELIVLSDEDSKGPPSPNKQDKLPNPYVKLVDTAFKKKNQKKGQKNSKRRSSKTKITSDKEPKRNSQSSECDDVELMEVDVQIHQEGEEKVDKKPNVDLVQQNDKLVTATVETNNNSNSKDLANSQNCDKSDSIAKKLEQNTTLPEKSSKQKQTSIVSDIEGVVCIDDLNSSDIQVSQSTSMKNEDLSIEKDKNKETSVVSAKSTSDTKEGAQNNIIKKETKKRVQLITLSSKASSKNKKNGNEVDSGNKEDEKIDNNKKQDNTDIELVTSTENRESTDKTETSDKQDISDESSKQPEVVTPKRSTRQKKDESNLNMSSTSSKLDESITSNPSTPKHNKSLSETSQLDKSINNSLNTSNLTPKQMQKKLEAAKKREEKERERLEREKKKQQEKEEREKQRKEKEEQKKKEREEKEEAKRKEKEEKEEQKRKEREEKEKQKEMERKARELKEEQKKKEKEDKEEQRRKEREAKEEERRKKQEALELEKQEQELKKKKAAEAFVNFFVPKQKVEKEGAQETGPVSKNSMLSSFTIKGDMRLAPPTRSELDDERREILDKFLTNQSSSERLYLKDLKEGAVKPICSGKTWPLEDKDNDVMIVEDELPPIDEAGEVITCESAPREKLRPKLLSFHENRRPPYWGTWRKKSAFVTPRRPFGQEKILDYEVDSDDDWEDEADGESLDGSAGGSEDEAGADDYEVDNEVFVPHGYLSDEEATMDEDDDVLNLSPETQKARLKHLEDEFESELKKPTEKLKPRLYGPLWASKDGGKPENCVDALWNYFEKFAMIMNDVTPLLQPAPEPDDTEKKKAKKRKIVTEDEGKEQSPKSDKKKKQKSENKEKKPKQEAKKVVPNQPGINNFLKKVKPTQIA